MLAKEGITRNRMFPGYSSIVEGIAEEWLHRPVEDDSK